MIEIVKDRCLFLDIVGIIKLVKRVILFYLICKIGFGKLFWIFIKFIFLLEILLVVEIGRVF